MRDKPGEFVFSEQYERTHVARDVSAQPGGLARKVLDWRFIQVARNALKLADQPCLVLDLPCGVGGAWSLLAEKDNRVIIGADHSAELIAQVCAGQPAEVAKRVQPLQTSAFSIELSENSVDCIFSMDLVHRLGEADERLTMLREFHRVTRDSVILSTWVDGNLKAWRQRRGESARQPGASQPPRVIPARCLEEEFRQAGFIVQKHIDLIPLLHMWRIYILRKE
jgi:SAM-dependent methyltransferase